MARLLLGSRGMKVWALLPLLASSGCLFLDSLNHAPTVRFSTGITSANKGSFLTLVAEPTDAEDAPPELQVNFTVFDGDHQPLEEGCDYESTKSGKNFTVRFFRPGIFSVEAVAIDTSFAASPPASVMLDVSDAPPRFDTQAMVAPTTAPDQCLLNAAGSKVTLALTAPPGLSPVSDADAESASPNPSCAGPETLTFTWHIKGQPQGSHPFLTRFDNGSCVQPTLPNETMVVATDAATQVCLWTDPVINGATAMYDVSVDVDDGTTLVPGPVGNVAVGPDQPPCITGTNPVAGSYVVDRTQLQRFAVGSVIDDRDVFGTDKITFAWSIWRDSDPVWRPVPKYPLSTYTLDPSSFDVGESVRVRVEAIDHTGYLAPPSICPIDADDCQVSSCAVNPDVCHKWKTWDLALR